MRHAAGTRPIRVVREFSQILIRMDETDETAGVTERLVAPVDTRQGGFRLALVLAALLHAAFLVQIGRAVPRSIGDPSGQTDAISVEIVNAADLESRETVALPPAGVAAPPPTPPPVEAAPRPQEPPQPDAAEAPQPAEPAPEAAQSPAPPTDAKQAESKQADQKQPEPKEAEQKAEKKAEELPNFETALADLANEPMPSDKPSEDPKEKTETPAEPAKAAQPAEPQKKAEAGPKPAEPAKKEAKKTPPKKQAALDMTQPSPDAASAPPGRSAAATRPPGITRSGENDEFGRAVIRALRSTMPPPRGVLGSVVVRLILTENGDLAEVRVLQPSGRRGLDESVVFATKQTYFPLPPYQSTLADRTFTIRYVYR